ncbi:sigma-54 interaction domain-containing protein [Pseudoflavonifractor phocaeensis]|uniref:sigma-54 interaction domain-containing protein n=1 Tax=Pseudoflavonifractor phocaeensis TaxID=1870988 RepID=UPI00195E3756|nr:sigma 54-interacting transcriptional regulator [Pseudoflavonifractor phocaeensis]MBM6722221.1 sigma 54-interacting transcriptional regulator [Pseudoflavonifractor phocaeensis]
MINRNIFLHMPKEMLAAILEQLPNPVYAIQDDYTVLYANREAQSILNVHPGMQLREKDGVLTAPGWEQETMLSQETSIQDIYRVSVNGTGYLCFQKYIPEDMDKSIFSVVSVQPEAPEYDLYFDCNQSAVHSSADRRFLSHSPQMEPVLKSCQRCAPSELPILLLGESGSGKTMMAEYIHRLSSRRNGPFLVVNCAAIAKELLESELFGYAPYAFTNASPKGKKGLFELANGGTLLLDEIGDMPLELQSKILTAVESQSILPVGGQEYRPVDVRILAATNKDLTELVRQGAFREDLLWRLNTVEIRIPPLRERPDDILYIANHFRNAYNEHNGTDLRFTPELKQFLREYDWPGNVRQLKNTVEKMLFMARDMQIPLSAARGLFGSRGTQSASATYAQRIEERERRFIQTQYRRYPSTRKLAAALQVSQSTATRLIHKYITPQTGHNAISAITAHTQQENAAGRLTQQQFFMILDVIPNRICVVDQDLVCIAKRYQGESDDSSASPDTFLTTAMYRAGYKLAGVKGRPIVLEYLTASGKQRQTMIAPINDIVGKGLFYVSATQIHFSQETIQRRMEICRKKRHIHVGNKDFVFFGVSAEMNLFLQDAVRSGWQDLSVLIRGESGTGKSVFARYIHEVGSRRSGPFVSINCASIPHNLIESELFGYEKGAFTGAGPQGRKGLFEMANGGTLFLDEIGDLPLNAQAKFLDVIENKRFIPVGGSKVINADVRIICATNQDLQKLIQEKKFREDLYWRINVIELQIPSLRNRDDDIERYAEFFLEQSIARYGTKKRFSPDVMSLFLLYSWPGNLRQLANVVERSYVMSEGSVILPEDLPAEFQNPQDASAALQFSEMQRRWDNEIISDALSRYGSAQEAAAALSVSNATVSRKRANLI